jgi:hypothetical protein
MAISIGSAITVVTAARRDPPLSGLSRHPPDTPRPSLIGLNSAPVVSSLGASSRKPLCIARPVNQVPNVGANLSCTAASLPKPPTIASAWGRSVRVTTVSATSSAV